MAAPAQPAAPAPAPAQPAPQQQPQQPPQQQQWHQVPYAEASYWEARYGKGHEPFEWFLGYSALRRVLRAFLSKRKPVLQIGCGTSNIQEGMAKAGWTTVNVDIARNVIEKLREQHAGVPGLTYEVADCRDMPAFGDCQFGGVLDKGTVDALLCSKDGVSNVVRMFAEASRILTPGGTFLLISLGDPTRRLCLLCSERFDWTVQVLLLPKIAPDNQATVEGRPINDTLNPVDFLGPFEVLDSETLVGLPRDTDYSRFFFGYVCKKRRLTLPLHPEQRQRLPQGWVSSSRVLMAKLQQEMGLPADLLSRGKRTRTATRQRTAPTGLPGDAASASASASALPSERSDRAEGGDEGPDGSATPSAAPPPRTQSVPNLVLIEAAPAAVAAAAVAAAAEGSAAAAAASSLQRLQELQQQAEAQQHQQQHQQGAPSPPAEPVSPPPQYIAAPGGVPGPSGGGDGGGGGAAAASPDRAASLARAPAPAAPAAPAGGEAFLSMRSVAAALLRPDSECGASRASEDEFSEAASSAQYVLESASEVGGDEEPPHALAPATADHAQRVRRHSAPPTEALLRSMRSMLPVLASEPCVPPEPPKKGAQRMAECDDTLAAEAPEEAADAGGAAGRAADAAAAGPDAPRAGSAGAARGGLPPLAPGLRQGGPRQQPEQRPEPAAPQAPAQQQDPHPQPEQR